MALSRRTPLKRGGRIKPVGKRGERRRADYQAHMRSAYWKAVRLAVIERDGGCCQASPECRGILTVDHKSYAFWRRELEGLETLQTLCEYHHSLKDGWKHR